MLRILAKTSVVNIDRKFVHRTKNTLNTASKRAKFTVKGDKPKYSDRVKKKKHRKSKREIHMNRKKPTNYWWN